MFYFLFFLNFFFACKSLFLLIFLLFFLQILQRTEKKFIQMSAENPLPNGWEKRQSRTNGKFETKIFYVK